MTPETATEWYQFTCHRCRAQWNGPYQVRRFTDDAGRDRVLYTRHGQPCEAPARAQTACPACGHSPVQVDLLVTPPARELPAPAAAGRAGHPVLPHRYEPLDASRQFLFKAVISLGSFTGCRPQNAARSEPEVRSLMVRVPDPDERGTGSFLPAVIARDDDLPLLPGDGNVVVTISVPSGEAPALFSPGSRFALWAGTDVGQGVVTRRVFVR